MQNVREIRFQTEGLSLNCLDYGGEGKPPILFLQSGSAHAHWRRDKWFHCFQRYREIEYGYHHIMFDNPDGLNAVLKSFLAGLKAGNGFSVI